MKYLLLSLSLLASISFEARADDINVGAMADRLVQDLREMDRYDRGRDDRRGGGRDDRRGGRGGRGDDRRGGGRGDDHRGGGRGDDRHGGGGRWDDRRPPAFEYKCLRVSQKGELALGRGRTMEEAGRDAEYGARYAQAEPYICGESPLRYPLTCELIKTESGQRFYGEAYSEAEASLQAFQNCGNCHRYAHARRCYYR